MIWNWCNHISRISYYINYCGSIFIISKFIFSYSVFSLMCFKYFNFIIYINFILCYNPIIFDCIEISKVFNKIFKIFFFRKLIYFFSNLKLNIPLSEYTKDEIIDLIQVFPLLGYDASQIIIVKKLYNLDKYKAIIKKLWLYLRSHLVPDFLVFQ